MSGEDTLLAFERAAAEFAKVFDVAKCSFPLHVRPHSFELASLPLFTGQDIELKGFRKGTKVPTQVVAARVGVDVVKSRALQDLSQRATARVSQSGEAALIGESVFDGGGDEPMWTWGMVGCEGEFSGLAHEKFLLHYNVCDFLLDFRATPQRMR